LDYSARMKFVKLGSSLLLFLFASTVYGQDATADRAELLNLHATVINAHVKKDLASWMAIEIDTTISVNNGSISHLGRSERQNAREAYLNRTKFDSYRDLSAPIVKVSEDGSLGWVIAEVEVIGWTANSDGSIEDISNVFAWIELYEKTPLGWKMSGNVSNSRPL
jgi:hypothetical protein